MPETIPLYGISGAPWARPIVAAPHCRSVSGICPRCWANIGIKGPPANRCPGGAWM